MNNDKKFEDYELEKVAGGIKHKDGTFSFLSSKKIICCEEKDKYFVPDKVYNRVHRDTIIMGKIYRCSDDAVVEHHAKFTAQNLQSYENKYGNK